MRPEIRGHAEWSNAAAYHQPGLLRVINRGGQAAPDSRQLLGSCPAQNGGNGKALGADREQAAGGRRHDRTAGARDALIFLARGHSFTGCPTGVGTVPHFPSKPRPTCVVIVPHLSSKCRPTSINPAQAETR